MMRLISFYNGKGNNQCDAIQHNSLMFWVRCNFYCCIKAGRKEARDGDLLLNRLLLRYRRKWFKAC